MVWNGANDYLYETTPDIDGLTTQIVNKINESAIRLLNQGAHGVLIINLPDLSRTPYARNHQLISRLHDMTWMHNTKLDTAVKNLSAKYPNKVMFFDIYTIFNDLLANPDKYNKKHNTHVTDTTNSCWLGTVFGLNDVIDKKVLEDELKVSGADQASGDAIMLSPALRNAYLSGQQYNDGKKPCDNADQYLFWDDLHPSAVVHKVLGEIIIEELEKSHWL